MEERQRTLSSPPASIRPGRTIAGKYVLESMLGSGAMGTVWIATHVNLGSKVAVKLVSTDFAKSEEARARFLAEAKAAAALRSRYVVQMFDSGVTDGAPYIVMEYLKGESLEERLQRIARLPVEHVVRIIGQVAKGLERAHSKNIVHRDLKPANIFLASTEDGEEVAKILDFGIAKMDHEDHDYKATATGVIMGTPLYMSPEQARGLKSLDHTSDLYSLGMVAYTALVGDVPFHAESFGDLVYTLCTQDIPNTQQVAPWLPPTLDAWFRQACHKDPTQRFRTADQMYQALAVASQITGSRLPQTSLDDSSLRIDPSGTSPFAGNGLSNSNLGNSNLGNSGLEASGTALGGSHQSYDSSNPDPHGRSDRFSNPSNSTVALASMHDSGSGHEQSGPWSPATASQGTPAGAMGQAANAHAPGVQQANGYSTHDSGGVGDARSSGNARSLTIRALIGAFVALLAAGGAGLWWFTSQPPTASATDLTEQPAAETTGETPRATKPHADHPRVEQTKAEATAVAAESAKTEATDNAKEGVEQPDVDVEPNPAAEKPAAANPAAPTPPKTSTAKTTRPKTPTSAKSNNKTPKTGKPSEPTKQPAATEATAPPKPSGATTKPTPGKIDLGF